MSRKRHISWSAALRDLKSDRTARPDIREERLNTYGSGPKAQHLTAWRGLSSRRHIFYVYGAAETFGLSAETAVLLGVSRDENGSSVIVSRNAVETEDQLQHCISVARARGADELHIHRALDASDDCNVIVADLTDAAVAQSEAA